MTAYHELGVASPQEALAAKSSGNLASAEADSQAISVQLPTQFSLSQNYPNPFEATVGTVIQYALPDEAEVSMKVYDLLGKEVATLISARQAAGYRSVTWNGRDASGQSVGSGVYMVTLRAGEFEATRKVTLLR